MDTSNLTHANGKYVPAIFCAAYIAIQIFQRYVFISLPVPKTLSDEVTHGAMPIHIWRSTLLLLSFFGMIYVYTAIIFHDFKKNVLLYTVAFTGLIIFCSLEIVIRSVELFYIQLQLPTEFINTKNEVTKNLILDKYATFQSVQYALYFPLLFSQAVSSLIIAFLFSLKSKLDYLIKFAFAINAIRLAARLAGMFLHIEWLNNFSRILYLPLVIIIFGLLIIWFVKSKQDAKSM